jgi:hypothetical protein
MRTRVRDHQRVADSNNIFLLLMKNLYNCPSEIRSNVAAPNWHQNLRVMSDFRLFCITY